MSAPRPTLGAAAQHAHRKGRAGGWLGCPRLLVARSHACGYVCTGRDIAVIRPAACLMPATVLLTQAL
jgi:hypothetical protein